MIVGSNSLLFNLDRATILLSTLKIKWGLICDLRKANSDFKASLCRSLATPSALILSETDLIAILPNTVNKKGMKLYLSDIARIKLFVVMISSKNILWDTIIRTKSNN
jgi:hypothetical protein